VKVSVAGHDPPKPGPGTPQGPLMQIWVDVNACPGVIKKILYRAAERVRVPLILVADQPLTPRVRC